MAAWEPGHVDLRCRRGESGGGVLEELDARLQRWVEAGLLDPEQADAIQRHEAAATRSEPGQGRDLSRLAEVVGYLGGVLVLVGIVVVLGEFWDQLETWAHLLILVTAAVLLAGAAWWSAGTRGDATDRLSSVLWLLSILMVAISAGIVSTEVLRIVDETAALVVSGPTAAYATVLWFIRRRPLEQVAAFAALLALLLSLLVQVPRLEPEGMALAVWAFAVIWLLLSWSGAIRPRGLGYALGGLSVLGAAQVLAAIATSWGQALGLGSAAALLVVSMPLASVALLALGVVGAFGFITQIVFTHFAETLGLPLVLFTVGALLIGGALLIVRLRPVVTSDRGERP